MILKLSPDFSPKGRDGSKDAVLLCFSRDDFKLTATKRKIQEKKIQEKTLPAHTLAVSRETSSGTHWNLIEITTEMYYLCIPE